MNSQTSTAQRASAEEVLGRRLRPWWGKSPVDLITRGIFQGVIYGFVGYACIRILNDTVDLSEYSVAEYRDTVVLVATIVAVLIVLGLAYCVVRIVVGILDIVGRRKVEGVLLHAKERFLGDLLRGPIRWLWEQRRRQHQRDTGYSPSRRKRLQLVIDTPGGPKSWTVRHKYFRQDLVGQRVRITAGPILGYVTRIEAAPGPASSTQHGSASQTA